MTETTYRIVAAGYAPCVEADIPAGVQFTTPRRNQGQIVEVSYGGFGRSEFGFGDPYRHRIDRSDGSSEYARWVKAEIDPALRAAAKRLSTQFASALAQGGSMGEGAKAIGLEWADWLALQRQLHEDPSLQLALAWVQAGRPEIARR